MFNYNDFRQSVYKKFEEQFDIHEVDKILTIPDGYNRDNPDSTGKRLKINRIKFTGKKSEDINILFDTKLFNGVNVWIAENFRGKSSIFKMIKFALTGKNSLKKDVKEWIDEIFLEIQINSNIYSIYLNLEYRILNGGLYKIGLDEFLQNKKMNKEIEDLKIVFKANGKNEFAENINEFFFHMLSFYSLKWTQKSSSKSEAALKESGTTWATYFKSIFLESKDYSNLFLNNNFGNQDQKILEMILGLELTYPINRLKLKKDFYQYEIAQYKESDDNLQNVDIINLEKELKRVELEIENYKKNRFKIDMQKKIKTYNKLVKKVMGQNKELKNIVQELINLDDSIDEIKKNIIDIEEYLEIGIYFNNIDIEICPHCNNKIGKGIKQKEKETDKCMLCDNEVSNKEINKELYEIKLRKLNKQLRQLNQIYDRLTSKKETVKKSYDKNKKILNTLEEELNNNDVTDIETDLEKLISERGIIEYRIKTLKSNNKVIYDKKQNLENIVNLLDYALQFLKDERKKRSINIINRLQDLIIEQLHDFGLYNISEVIIDTSLNIKFKQNNFLNSFNELNEGEKLRVKISFFLSLIQLDIEYKFGRHPRLLIIDSPGKEEVIKKDLLGLKNDFNKIEQSIGGELQILVGTALYELSDASVKEKVNITPREENVF